MNGEIPRDGAMHPLTVDPRDRKPDASHVSRLGRVVGALTLHVVGVTDRETVETSLRQMVEQMPRPADETMQGPLCGVQHVEDIGIWQTPYSGRDVLRREIVRLRRQHCREVVIVHGYQHVGPCEASS